jgi:hypothetical protein
VSLLATLFLLIAQAPAAETPPPEPVPRPVPERVEPVPPPLVTWDELVRDRSKHLGKRVRLTVQISSVLATWDPYLTRFGPGEYIALAGWDDGQFPWQRAAFEAPAVRFFVRRGTALETALAAAPRYRRYEVEVEVRELFREQPWVEVRQVKRLEHALDEGTIIHAARALLLNENGTWSLAVEELDRALAGDLPRKARAELERLRTLCRERDAAKRSG